MKLILLNKEQRILFDWIKPSIEIDFNSSRGKSSDLFEIMMKSLDIGQNPDKQIEEMHNVIKLYEEKMKGEEGQLNEIDRNLLEFFKD